MKLRTQAQRGRSRVRRNTHDIDDKVAQVHAPLGDDGSFESSVMTIEALLETIRRARSMTADAVRYGQGMIGRVAEDTLAALLDRRHGYDHWSGTNDLAASQIARVAACSKRQWYRVKPQLEKLGLISFTHRSIRTGLAAADGVEQHLQISDIYWFSPSRLVPWLREIFDQVLAAKRAAERARARRAGSTPKRTPLVKRDRPHRRIPALLNPIGWARAVAGEVKAATSYADQEARALAFATQLALRASSG